MDSIDSAVAYDSTSLPILRMTNDGLVAYDQASGLAGAQLVPDLAVSLPNPTDGGRTYTFQLRPNSRYSNGKPVKASDFRSTFERDYKIGKLPVQYYDGIVGAARCKQHPTRCDLSRGIVADDAAKTVSFHLVAPDPEFLYKIAFGFGYVLPAGTPAARVHHASAAGNRPVRDHELPAEPHDHARAQSALPRVVESGTAGRLPGQDRVQDRRHTGRGGERGDQRQGRTSSARPNRRRLRPRPE